MQQILIVNGVPSEMSQYAANELVRSVIISLFLGLGLATTMKSKAVAGTVFGATHTRTRPWQRQGHGFGF